MVIVGRGGFLKSWLAGNNRSTQRKICLRTNLSTTIVIWTTVVLNPHLVMRTRRPVALGKIFYVAPTPVQNRSNNRRYLKIYVLLVPCSGRTLLVCWADKGYCVCDKNSSLLQLSRSFLQLYDVRSMKNIHKLWKPSSGITISSGYKS
jgi:hypothetical protein